MNWLQHHWYRITPLHLFLFPISLIFRTLVALRRELYRCGLYSSQKLPLPVIMVGNISVGGTGKTPLTLALATQLGACGLHPVIVSRGYGRTGSEPLAVSLSSTSTQAGDEPLLMAKREICPVWVGADRVATARAAIAAHPQCDVVLCDDGLQHYRLRRDMEIAVIDGARGFGNGLMLPAGPLREPESRLLHVNAIVINEPTDSNAGKSANEPALTAHADGIASAVNQYSMRLRGEIFYNLLAPDRTAIPADFFGKNIHAVAGIGHPQRFFQHLKSLGILCTPHAFPDHHPYLAADLSYTDCDAVLLTEKDAVKCTAFADERFWVLRVDAQIDSALIDHILRKIESHGSKIA